MRLQIVRIADRGVPNLERLHLAVVQEAALSYYIVLATRYQAPTAVVNKSVPAYWFPNRQVKPGDQVILYTGSGEDKSRVEGNGSTTYFFHWGLAQTVFNDPLSAAVVVEAANWATSPQGG